MKYSEQTDRLIAMSIISKERRISYGRLQQMLASGEISETVIANQVEALRNRRRRRRRS